MSKPTRARRGENHHAAQLTGQSVAQMRRLHYDEGLCIKCISKLYDVRYATAWEAINYVTWKHVMEHHER